MANGHPLSEDAKDWIWEAHGGQKWISVREDWLERLVLRFEQQVAELERKIKAHVQALEEALAGIGAERQEAEEEELAAQLARLPDLGQALREAPAAVKRQVFESFELRIAYDKVRAAR